jgi:hypothetical protein
VVVADEGYLFDELTDHPASIAETNTALSMKDDCSTITASVRPFSG